MTDLTKIERELPQQRVDLLTGNNFAAAIVESCSVAYWLADRDNFTALYHLQKIHENFAELADALGYDITPKPATEPAFEVAA